LHGQAFAVHDGVDLGAEPPARPPHLLGSVAGDAGSVLVHTDDRRVDHLHGRIMGCGQGGHDLIPDACLAPANEAIVAGGVGSVAPRQIAPRCSGPQHLEDTIEGAPVIHTRDTARPVGEHRLDDAPFAIGEFVSHDPDTPVGSWNHASRPTSERLPHVRKRPRSRHVRTAGRVRILTPERTISVCRRGTVGLRLAAAPRSFMSASE
jgi:hypothetical protein